MREAYLDIYEIVSSFLRVVIFYYTIYQCYKIGYAFRVKKSVIEVAKTNKFGFFTIFSYVALVSLWLFFIYSTEESLNKISFTPRTPSEWSLDMPKGELEERSKSSAQYAFIFSGKGSLHYDAKLDQWIQFTPSDTDIEEHDENLIQKEQSKNGIRNSINFIFWVGSTWIIIGLIGWYSGRRSTG